MNPPMPLPPASEATPLDDPLERTLDDLLRDEGYRFEFFQAVRLLEKLLPDRKPLGRDFAPRQEVARLRCHSSLQFPASELNDVRFDEDRPPQVFVRFFGMTGLLGALPQHYTEIILERQNRKDTTLRDFLDLFNHRLLSLFYRAWEKYRFWIQGERTIHREAEARGIGGEVYRSFVIHERPRLDPVSDCVLSLAGLGQPALRYRLGNRHELTPRLEISDETLRYYSGLLAQRHRSAMGLEHLLEDYFRRRVRIQQMCGQWLVLDEPDRTRLSPGQNTQLGVSTVAGWRVWDAQGKFRVRIGPVGYAQFCDLLPIGSANRPLTQLARLYAGQQFDFDLELCLWAREAPRLRLGERQGIGPRLGWNTWVRSAELPRDVVTVVLQVRESLLTVS